MRIALAALATLTALISTVAAQPSMTPPSGPGTLPPTPAAPYYPYQPPAPSYAPPPQQVEAPKDLKREGTARGLAIGATAVGLLTIGASLEQEDGGMFVGGLALSLIGPSLGHIYAGETGHAVKMSLLRTGGLIAVLAGAISYNAVEDSYADCAYDSGCSYPAHDSDKDKAKAAMWIGGAVVVVGTIYDFVDSARAVKRYNDKQRPALMFGPTMIQGTRGAAAVPAVGLSGAF